MQKSRLNFFHVENYRTIHNNSSCWNVIWILHLQHCGQADEPSVKFFDTKFIQIKPAGAGVCSLPIRINSCII